MSSEFIVTLFIGYSIFRNIGFSRVFKTIFALILLSFWNTSTLVYRYLNLNYDAATLFVISLTLLIVCTTLYGVNTLQVSPIAIETVKLAKAVKSISWILVGLLIGQLLNPELQFIAPSDGPLPIPQPSLIYNVYTTIWGSLVVLFLYKTELSQEYIYNNNLNQSYSLIGAYIGLTSVILLVLQPLFLIFNLDILLHTIFYGLTKILLNFSVLLILVEIYDHPWSILPLTRSLKYQFKNKKVSCAFVSYEDYGPQPRYSQGFDFVSTSNETREDYIKLLGVIGMTTLGIGDEYIEGSALIPLPKHDEFTGLVISSFVKDMEQLDPRLDGQNYVTLILVLPKKIEWMLGYRTLIEENFHKKMHSLDDINKDFNEIKFFNFVEDQLLEILLII